VGGSVIQLEGEAQWVHGIVWLGRWMRSRRRRVNRVRGCRGEVGRGSSWRGLRHVACSTADTARRENGLNSAVSGGVSSAVAGTAVTEKEE